MRISSSYLSFDSATTYGISLFAVVLFACGSKKDAVPTSPVDAGGVDGPSLTDASVDAGGVDGLSFTDDDVHAGVKWKHIPFNRGASLDAYDHGNGLAAGDFNGDGHDDLLVLSQCGPSGYFLGHGDGTFTDRSELVTALNDGIRVAVTYGDYDNDGLTDFYVTYTRHPNVLLHQKADGTFENVAAALGVAAEGHYSGATFADINGDGFLDIVVAGNLQITSNEIIAADGVCPEGHAGYSPTYLFDYGKSDSSLFFINGGRAKGFAFTEEGQARGVPSSGDAELRHGFGDVTVADFDKDGDVDLFFAEMFDGTSVLLENDGTGHFKDANSTRIPRPSWGAPSATFGDFDNNGMPDLYMVDMHSDMWIDPRKNYTDVNPLVRYNGNSGTDSCLDTGPNRCIGDRPTGPLFGNSLWLQAPGGGAFNEVGMSWHAETFQPWGVISADFDNDGDLDVFIPSGMSHPYPYWANAFLRNSGHDFAENAKGVGLDPPAFGVTDPSITIAGQVQTASSRAAVTADFDEDGDLDMVVINWQNRLSFYKNNLPRRAHYLDMLLKGKAPTDPIGAIVEVKTAKQTYVRWVEGASGYLSQSTRRIHLGLGDTASVESVTIHWPSPAIPSVVTAPAIDQRIVIEQP